MAVVGASGFFGQTFDDQNWSSRTIANVPLFSVACADNIHGWASGAGGFVAHTADGGSTWLAQTSHLTSDLHAINFGWSSTGVVAGDAGQLAVTPNGGQSWRAITPLTNVALRGAAVAPYASVMVVVGDGGTVLRSANAGGTWSLSKITGAGDLRGVTSDWYGDVIVAVDSNGAIWSSADRGITFAFEAKAPFALDNVSANESGANVLAVGKSGTALVRSSTGTWTTLATGTSADLHAALVSAADGHLYVAGDNGTLRTSADMGATWITKPLGTTVPLYGLQDL